MGPRRHLLLACAILTGCSGERAPFVPAADSGAFDASERGDAALELDAQALDSPTDAEVDASRDAGTALCDPPLAPQTPPELDVACSDIPRDPLVNQIAWFRHTLVATSVRSPSLAMAPHDVLLALDVDGEIVLYRAVDPRVPPAPVMGVGRGRAPQLAWSAAGARFGLAYHDSDAGDVVLVELDASATERRRLRAHVPGSVELLARPYWTGCRWLVAWTGDAGVAAGVFTEAGFTTTWTDATLDGVSSAGSEWVPDPSLDAALAYTDGEDVVAQWFDAEGVPTFTFPVERGIAPGVTFSSVPGAVIHDATASAAWAGHTADGAFAYEVKYRTTAFWGASTFSGFRSFVAPPRVVVRAAPDPDPLRGMRVAAAMGQGYTVRAIDDVQRWYLFVSELGFSFSRGLGYRIDDLTWTAPRYEGPVATDVAHHPCGVLVAWDENGLSNRIGLLVDFGAP